MTTESARRRARGDATSEMSGAGSGSGLRARKRQQVRARLLDVCGRLFREQGFDETTVDAIAAAAEVSRQTFFNYFTSKETALGELGLAWLLEQTEHAWRGERAMGERSPFDVIRAGIRSQLEAIERDPDFMRLVFTRSGLIFPHGAHVGTGADARRLTGTHVVFDAIAGLMRRGQEAGAIRRDLPAEQAAEIYVSVMLITIRLWLTGYWGEAEGLVERGLRALDVLEDGLRAGAGARTAGDGRRGAAAGPAKAAPSGRLARERARGSPPGRPKKQSQEEEGKKHAAKRRPTRRQRRGSRSPR